jgi:hypothetical protein
MNTQYSVSPGQVFDFDGYEGEHFDNFRGIGKKLKNSKLGKAAKKLGNTKVGRVYKKIGGAVVKTALASTGIGAAYLITKGVKKRRAKQKARLNAQPTATVETPKSVPDGASSIFRKATRKKRIKPTREEIEMKSIDQTAENPDFVENNPINVEEPEEEIQDEEEVNNEPNESDANEESDFDGSVVQAFQTRGGVVSFKMRKE